MGAKRTQFIAVNDVGEPFRKHHYDERLGWHGTAVSRWVVREDLITRLIRSSLAADHSHDVPINDPDTSTVKPTRELQLL